MTQLTSIPWQTAMVKRVCADHLHSACEWLSEREWQEMARIRDPRRHSSGLAARFVAKQLFGQRVAPGSDAREIEVLSRDGAGKHIRPCVWLAGKPTKCTISLAHTADVVLVALTSEPDAPLGVDLVPAAPLSSGFVRAWFTRSELEMVWQGDEFEACRLWGIKEAAYKAVNRDEPFRPRRFTVRRLPSGDYACAYGAWDLGHRGEIRVWECFEHIAVLLAAPRHCTCEPYSGPG